jgi:DNA-binding XRE family transcriptional regulator
MDTTEKKIIKKLKMLIKNRFGTQKNMAKIMETSERSVVFWLKGEPLPNLEFLIKLANYCQVDISYFFTDESSPADILDSELFDEIFNHAYTFAEEHNLKIKGTFFLGVYQLITETMQRDKVSIEEAFEINKKTILRIVNTA